MWALRGKSGEGAAEVLSLQQQQQSHINEPFCSACCAAWVRLCSSCCFPRAAETPPCHGLGTSQAPSITEEQEQGLSRRQSKRVQLSQFRVCMILEVNRKVCFFYWPFSFSLFLSFNMCNIHLLWNQSQMMVFSLFMSCPPAIFQTFQKITGFTIGLQHISEGQGH